METKRISEDELIDPVLFELNKYKNGLTTGQIISLLTEELQPSGEDIEILFGRRDTRFSQKVRNLISHKTILPYVDYDSNSSLWKINENGIGRLKNSFYYKNKEDNLEQSQSFEYDGAEDLVYADTFENFDNIDKKYVDCEPLNYSVYELKRRYSKKNQSGALILDDSFQRNNVWTKKQKSQLIESLLMGIPIPYLYLYEGKNSNLIVIDGRQRLSAIFDFLDNFYALTNMEFLKNLEGKKVEDLSDSSKDKLEKYRAKLEDSHLHVIKVGYETPEIFKLKIFERVNQNGTKLNNQELRHALHQGAITILLQEISDKIDILGSKNAKLRMKDRYLILRYISMRLYILNELKFYTANKNEKNYVVYNEINEFLSNAMDAINTFNEKQIEDIKTDFLWCYNEALSIFNEQAFRLDKGSPINMILFEVTLIFISLTKSCNYKDEIIRQMLEDFKNYDYQNVDEDGNTPFFQNIKYHRDGKENFYTRIIWIKNIIKKYKKGD